jgi:hypothetical protein
VFSFRTPGIAIRVGAEIRSFEGHGAAGLGLVEVPSLPRRSFHRFPQSHLECISPLRTQAIDIHDVYYFLAGML